jgi:serine/threonine protein kinase
MTTARTRRTIDLVPARNGRIEAFNLTPGRTIAGKYDVEALLGGGWEGEVYRVQERRTGAKRAAKLFFPHRNENDKSVNFYARKLERLRECPIIIQYHNAETIRLKGHKVTVLISEFVDGVLLDDLIRAQPGGRFRSYEALHLLHALASGLEDVHAMGEYHGDLHSGNVLVKRTGIFFVTKLVDMYHWGRPSAANIREDVINLVRILYDAIGGKKHYSRQPDELKEICCGLKRGMIAKKFPTAAHLREHLEDFEWC